jgi:hypothetical protein
VLRLLPFRPLRALGCDTCTLEQVEMQVFVTHDIWKQVVLAVPCSAKHCKQIVRRKTRANSPPFQSILSLYNSLSHRLRSDADAASAHATADACVPQLRNEELLLFVNQSRMFHVLMQSSRAVCYSLVLILKHLRLAMIGDW